MATPLRRRLGMQLKLRGSTVQLLRATYLPEKKRSIQTSLGTFDTHCRTMQDISEGILAALTAEEQEQLAAWLDRRELRRRSARQPYHSPAMNRIIVTVAAMLEIATEMLPDITIDKTDRQRLFTAWDRFTHTLESLERLTEAEKLVREAKTEPPPNRSDRVLEQLEEWRKTPPGEGTL
jgi:hypothetical protein